MAAFTSIVAGIGLGLQVMGMGKQQDAQDDARRAAEEQAAAQKEKAAADRRIADMKAVMATRAQVREARIKAGQVLNVGATASPGGSSIVAGAGAVQTQLGANLGFGSFVQSNNDISYAATGRIADANVVAAQAGYDYQQAQMLAGIGSTIFSMGGGFKTIFGGKGGTSGNDGIYSNNQAT